jgi:lysophospholipase L1-like esterase
VGIAACGSNGGDEEPQPPPPGGDHLVVSIGDSVASGEGNPDVGPGPDWQSPRCHRSLRSGQAVAAARVLGDEFGERFVSVACSGAQLDAGLIDGYGGIKRPPGAPDLPSQVDAVADAVEGKTVDALVVTAGANDVGFSKIVRLCLAPLGPCQRQRFHPDLSLEDRRQSPDPMEVTVPKAIAGLGLLYRELADALPPEIPMDRVIIVEYFDPTRGARGQDCPYIGITPKEMEWARLHVLKPLNAKIAETRDALGWKVVDGVDERFARRGICVDDGRWVARIEDSLVPQKSGLLGTMHPNSAGHQAIADEIESALAPLVTPPGG